MAQSTEKAAAGAVFDSGGLLLDTRVILAESSMTAAEAAQARRRGQLSLPAHGKARLEAGGVVLAEGELRQKEGRTVFVVSALAGKKENV